MAQQGCHRRGLHPLTRHVTDECDPTVSDGKQVVEVTAHHETAPGGAVERGHVPAVDSRKGLGEEALLRVSDVCEAGSIIKKRS